MKKVIVILAVMIAFVGAVFATSGDKITLISTIGQIKPEYQISVVGANPAVVGSKTDGAATYDVVDITEGNVTVSFELNQKGEKKGESTVTYCRYNGTIELGVEIKPFVCKDIVTSEPGAEQTTYATQSTAYKITAWDVANLATANLIGISAGSVDAATSTLTLTYYGKKVTDRKVGTFTATWTADPDLPILATGTTQYKADVILTYTVD